MKLRVVHTTHYQYDSPVRYALQQLKLTPKERPGQQLIHDWTIAIDGGQHLAGPGPFADLTGMTDAQWQTAREAIEQSTQRDKANRAG